MIKKFHRFIQENYVGINAASTDKRKRKHSVALEMERRGMEMEEIRSVTGWFKNPHDYKWRYEHDTSRITFKPMRELVKHSHYRGDEDGQYVLVHLTDLIQNTSLFREHSLLRRINVKLYAAPRQGDEATGGLFLKNRSGKSGTISVFRTGENLTAYHKLKEGAGGEGTETQMNTLLDGTLCEDVERLKGILLHEIQHVIQNAEGFALGGNDTMFQDKTVDYRELQRIKHLQDTIDSHPDLREATEKLKTLYLDFEDYIAHPYYLEYERLVKKYDADKSLGAFGSEEAPITMSAYDQYRYLAGEIESRDVAARASLPKKSTFIVYKSDNYGNASVKFSDIAEKDIVARFDTKKQAWDYYRKHDATWSGRGEHDLWVKASDSRNELKPLSSEYVNPAMVGKRYN
jgi:hypothetical protein